MRSERHRRFQLATSRRPTLPSESPSCVRCHGATVIITEYQRDSSSKRPRSFVVSTVSSAVMIRRTSTGEEERSRQKLDNRSFHISSLEPAVPGTPECRPRR